MDLPAALRNWQRWCLDTASCKPEGSPREWPMGKVMLPYKVMVTEDEALDEMARHKEPNEDWAMRIERWVCALPAYMRIAMKTHYIHIPDEMRRDWDLTSDQVAGWRFRRLKREYRAWHSLTGEVMPHVRDLDEYHRIFGAAYAELREAHEAYKEAA